MNKFIEVSSNGDFFISQEQLDLLVDGELGERERQELLRRMDQDPQAWRRCAIAFLEAQAWSGGVRSFLTNPPEVAASEMHGAEEIPPPVTPPEISLAPPQTAPGRTWLERYFSSPMVLAASMLLAFALGLYFHGMLNRPGDRDAGPELDDGKYLAIEGPGNRQRGAGSVIPASAGGNMSLEMEPPGSDRPIRVPIEQVTSLDDDWIDQKPDPIPSEVVKALERLGQTVKRQRQVIPYQLRDGRQVLVPVDDVQIVPAKGRITQ